MRYIAAILAALLLFPACSEHTPTPEPQSPAPQALLFYFVGTSLDYYFDRNLTDVETAVAENILGRSRIAAFRRTNKATGEWSIVEIRYNSRTRKAEQKVLRTYPAPELTDMNRYLADMIELVPAQSYGVVFGGHGSAWIPAGGSLQPRGAKAAGGEYPFGQAPLPGAEVTRYFGENGCMFDITDMAAHMDSTGRHFDYVIFDDCFMSNIESLYDMRHVTDYIISSPCEIMGNGFPYRTVIPHLFTDGGRGHDLEAVCRAFHDFYTSYTFPSGCVTLTVCSELDAMADAAQALYAGAVGEYDSNELQTYEPLVDHLFYDFRQYAEALSRDEALTDAFRRQFDRTFPESCRLHTDSYYSAYNRAMNPINYYSGVTVSEPADRYTDENQATAWYRATH